MHSNFIVGGEWGSASLNGVQSVICLVEAAFGPFFRELINTNRASVLHLSDPVLNPRCVRQSKTIWLHACNTDWEYYIFEFAHEFCHYQIRNDVVQNLRWFEESLCQLASVFVMRRIGFRYTKHPNSDAQYKLGTRILKRAALEWKDIKQINLDFSDWSSVELQMLVEDEYERGKNTYIALRLLPIFEKDPYLWSTILCLGDMPEWISFNEFIQRWHQLSGPEFSESIVNISRIFNIEI